MAQTAHLTEGTLAALARDTAELDARALLFARHARIVGVVERVRLETFGELCAEAESNLEAGTIPALSAIQYYALPPG